LDVFASPQRERNWGGWAAGLVNVKGVDFSARLVGRYGYESLEAFLRFRSRQAVTALHQNNRLEAKVGLVGRRGWWED